jgi:protein required for attachment to host cells
MTPPIQPGDKHYLVVVADESTAIVYTRETLRGPLQERQRFENDAARLKTGEIIAERGGRSFDSHGHGRHTMEGEKSDPKQHLASAFARDIADHIASDVHKGICRGYALVAAPRFLGTLRAEIGPRVTTEPYATIDKNVVGQGEDAVARLLDNP